MQLLLRLQRWISTCWKRTLTRNATGYHTYSSWPFFQHFQCCLGKCMSFMKTHLTLNKKIPQEHNNPFFWLSLATPLQHPSQQRKADSETDPRNSKFCEVLLAKTHGLAHICQQWRFEVTWHSGSIADRAAVGDTCSHSYIRHSCNHGS